MEVDVTRRILSELKIAILPRLIGDTPILHKSARLKSHINNTPILKKEIGSNVSAYNVAPFHTYIRNHSRRRRQRWGTGGEGTTHR